MKGKNQSVLRLIVLSAVVAISLLIGIVVYYDALVTDLQESSCKTLDEVLLQEKSNFALSLIGNRNALVGYAKLVAMEMDNKETLMESLDAIVKSTSFEYVFIASPDGMSLNSEGVISDVGDRDYFHAAMAGETVISDPVKSKIRDKYIIAVATPVMKDDVIVGVLIGSFKTEELNKLFMASFDGYGYTYVVTNTGEIIAKTESGLTQIDTGNLFDRYSSLDFYKNDSYESMRTNLVEGRGGHSQYRYLNQKRLMHYDKLEINDWNIIAVVSSKGIESTANHILKNAILLTAGLVAVFIMLLVYNLVSQKRFTATLTKMAYVDAVTGYRSFGKFKVDADALIYQHTDMNYLLVKLDIDNFKLINEIYTMEVGDRVLRALASALEHALDPERDVFGRIHADEFVVLVSYRSQEEEREKRLIFESTFWESCDALVSFRPILPQGRYRLRALDTDFAKIYENVNFAHRLAKTSDQHEVEFDGKVKQRAMREKEIENKMAAALLAEEFKMYLQPKYSLDGEKMVGAEALVRWIVGNEPIVYPDEFIPLFERNGFVTRIDYYMFEQACKTLRGWIDSGIAPIKLSVNFSRLHLSNDDFVCELAAIAEKYNVPHDLLEIELTETAMLESLDVLERVLLQLHDAGFTLSMDDFGSGYSSLGLLKNIPVDVIKIDKAFFDQSENVERARAVISSVLDMARKLDIQTVAEGVETQAHIDFLRELGCETVQGYYYAKPMPAEQVEIKLMRDLMAQ